MILRSSVATLLIALPILGPAQTPSAEHFSAYSWRSIGPANMGGRVSDISVVEGTKTFYVATGTSGLWKTTNFGTTFSPIFDREATSSIGSVVATKKDGKEIVWVGTGEGNGRNSSSWGNGVYRSDDGGSTWKHCGLEDSKDIPRIAVDPRNVDVCYVAALGHLWGPNKTRGVYKTSDGGKTWKPSLQIDENTGACWVQIDPKNPDTVYAAMYQRRRTAWSFLSGGQEGGIYKSTDAGASWKKLTKGLPSQTGRIGLDIFAGNSQHLMAIVESDLGGGRNIDDDRSRSGGIFKSTDGGESWERVNALAPRAFYFAKIKIDPKDENRVYVAGWNVLVSDDGGATFQDNMTKKLHVDWHAIAVDPTDSDHLLVGSDGGIHQSFDKGVTWDHLNTIAIGQFYNVAVDRSSPYRIMGGLQDNGSWIGPSSTNAETGGYNGGANVGIWNADWKVAGGGDGFHVAFDPTNPDIVYSESQGGFLTRVNLKTGVAKDLIPQPKEGQMAFRFNWNSPFLVSKHNPTTLYLGGQYVFKLTEKGNNWQVISPDLTTKNPDRMMTTGSNAETHCTIVSLAESPLKDGLLWSGSDDGLIHITQDGGKTWKNVTPKQVNGLYVAKLIASSHAEGTAYVAVDGHRSDNYEPLLLMTTDFGKSWRDITSNLPKGVSTRAIQEDLKSPDVLYAGTEQGVFLSTDRGATWINFGLGTLPTVGVHDIVQQPDTHDLVIATHGRSVYVLDDPSALGQIKPGFEKSANAIFAPTPAKPEIRWYIDGLYGDKYFGASNAPSGAKITFWSAKGGDALIEIKDKKGKVMQTLSSAAKPGFNRVSWDMRLQGVLPNKGEEPSLMFAPAGEYDVVLRIGGEEKVTKLTILPYDFTSQLATR